MGDVI